MTTPRPADRIRQVGVTLAVVLCIVGTLFGTGVIGEQVQDSAGGALSADATHLAPAGPAFSIWSVIYTGLVAYAIIQWLQGRATSERHRAAGWFAAGSMLLNAAWLLAVQADLLWLSVAVIVALLATLVLLVMRLQQHPESGALERIVTDGTFGLYLGWVTVATVANVAATLSAQGWRPEDSVAVPLAIALLAVLAVIGSGLAWRFGARWAVTAALVWGLGWLAFGRLADAPRSTPVAIAAIVAAVVIAVMTAVAWRRRRVAAA